jgi:hypothetical protein
LQLEKKEGMVDVGRWKLLEELFKSRQAKKLTEPLAPFEVMTRDFK